MLKLMLKLMLKAMLEAMLKLKAMLKAMLKLMLTATLKLMLKAMPKAMLKAKLKAVQKAMLKRDCPAESDVAPICSLAHQAQGTPKGENLPFTKAAWRKRPSRPAQRNGESEWGHQTAAARHGSGFVCCSLF